MLNNKTIAVIVPAYNEEKQISMVIETMPDFVDRIIVVNDCSKDNTADVVKSYFDKKENPECELKSRELKKENKYNRAEILQQEKILDAKNLFPESEVIFKNLDSRIILINYKKNQGNGKAIARGYLWALENRIDCTAVMDGDGQMDPNELIDICKPVIEENIDYVKGNRLIHRSAWLIMPKSRYIGNSILSIFTKIASGYWRVSDTQTGYTAMGLKALESIRLNEIYRSYGWPNDIMVKLNIAFCTLKEVEIKPVYNIGEKSKMKLIKVIPRISWLLFISFFKRLWIKYLFRDFHPLFILYHLGLILFLICIPYMLKIFKAVLFGYDISNLPILAFVFLFITGIQFLLFAMWMDIQDNERLYK
ncbi:MAG: glycosyltransferase family 2 protein [Bacteroidales bacterium]|jgi:glycosyltransferase involved in cell wall biosynthesis